MAADTRPMAKAVYLCDEVVPDRASQKINLFGVFNAFRLPDGESFPYTLGRMCVFAQMEDGEGDPDFQVRVVRADTGDVSLVSPVYRVRFPSRLALVTVNIRLLNCSFPTAGEYWVELYCDGEVLDDRVLHVID